MMEIKAINFDFYGTIVDWLPVWEEVCAKIVIENDLKVSPKEFAIEWRSAQRQFIEAKEFTLYREVIRLGLNAVCDKYAIKNKDYHEILYKKWKDILPFPEVPETLKKIRQKCRMVVCSNSARDFMDALLAKLPIKFDALLISDETKVNKPHPKMYALAIDALEVPKENILHIASSQMDVKGATNAGLTVCWINRRKEQRLPDTPQPSFEIHTLDEVLKILGI
jgi:2-haloacid dehalogenase